MARQIHYPRVLALCCAALALVGAQGIAAAEAPSAADVKRKADTEMESLRYAEALEDYSRAYAMTHDPALLYNRGRVLQALERFSEALDQIEKFARDASPELKGQVPKLNELLGELGRRVSVLRLHCPVKGARILVRNTVVATTPVAGPIRLNSGLAVIEVEAEGYQPFRREVDLPGGSALDVDVALIPRSPRGVLVVRSEPAGADVTVDGRALGLAPLEAELAPGTHRVEVAHEGYVETTTTAVVGDSQRKELDLTLEKSGPLTTKWWFWTGVGAVVVGGAVLTVALLTDRSASRGDIPPGQVAGPLLR